MNDSKGYYKVLGLEPGADIAAVKKAYKAKQVEFHPSGAFRRKIRESPEYKKLTQEQKDAKEKEMDELIAKVNEAFNVLGNETTKEAYDNGTGEYAQFHGMDMGGFAGFDDIFSAFTGGGFSSKKRKPKVQDTVTEVNIELKDAYLGKTNKYKIKTKKICKCCGGKGAEDLVQCSQCRGKGSVYVTKRVGFMITKTEQECQTCNGSGQIPKGALCAECSGERLVQESNIIELEIKPGVVDGQTYVFRGQGNQYPGCDHGDLVFKIAVKENKKFSREEDHLISTIDIDLLTALGGGVSYFEHIDGRKLAVNISPFKNFQDAIVIYGEGFKRNSKKGNLYLQPNILINSNLDRTKLSEYIKPIVSKPYGEYQNINGSFGKIPESKAERQDESGGAYHNFGSDFFRGFGFG